MINKIVSVLPVKSENVSKAIQNIATPASAAGLISLVVLVWAASGMMGAIRSSLERTMEIDDDRGIVRGKLIDFALVAATAVLVLASVGIGLVTQFVDSIVTGLAGTVGLQGGIAQAVVSKVIPLLLWTGTLFLVYRVVPAKRPRRARRDRRSGSRSVAAAVDLAGRRLHLLPRDQVERHLRLLTSVLVFLYSVYLFASAMLFGGAFAAEWSRPHPPDPESLLAKLRRRIRRFLHRAEESPSDP